MRYTTLAVLLAVAWPALAASHFPAETGNWWEFSYLEHQGGWGISHRDSGTVRWEVVSVQHFITEPGQTAITVLQTRALARSRTEAGIWGDHPPVVDEFDSLFDPPRLTRDTLVLRGVDGMNGLWFEGDSCWSFVLDPTAGTGNSRVTLVPQRVAYGADSIQATQVRPDACRAGSDTIAFTDCIEPRYFSTSEGIGPVAFAASSPTCLMDAFWGEEWQLLAAHIVTAVVDPGRRPAPGARALQGRGSAVEAFDLCGRRAPVRPAGVNGMVLLRVLGASPGVAACVAVVR
jgi:hypothetical protein